MIVAACSVHCAATQPLLTIDEAIANALNNNFDIKLSKNEEATAALDYTYRNAALAPRVNINSGLAFNNNDQYQKFTDGAVRQRKGIRSDNINTSVSLNWTLFNGGKLYIGRERAAAMLAMGELSTKNSISNTIARVIDGYYALVQQKQQLRAIQEQIEINAERVKLADYKLSIGVGTRPDLLQSKVDLNAQKAARLQQQTTLATLREELNTIMGLASNTLFEVADSIPFGPPILLNEIEKEIQTVNPTLLLAKKETEMAGLVLRSFKADRLPQLNFSGNYNFNRLDNKAVVNPFQPLFSRNSGLNAGITATLPVFNQYTVKRNIRAAQLSLTSRQLAYDQQYAQLKLSLIKAYNEYQVQQQALVLEEENIWLARENVAIVLDVYRLNATTLLQLKEAQKSLQDAYGRLIRARYLTKLAETELLRIKGALIR